MTACAASRTAAMSASEMSIADTGKEIRYFVIVRSSGCELWLCLLEAQSTSASEGIALTAKKRALLRHLTAFAAPVAEAHRPPGQVCFTGKRRVVHCSCWSIAQSMTRGGMCRHFFHI